MLHYNIKVTGKVQGVWFRKYTYEKALSLGLAGFVRNEVDGSVYVEAEGSRQKLEELILWLSDEGSPLSEVDAVTLEVSALKNFSRFIITH
ncbi:acylphosphatase [Sungkyunkwania multivorans]|uniref:Acylphosphatase n=1 Tax=Sungkyunkwania multivorans TaxID=1173618 RepID=A0ABW3CWE4_9FLAO